MMKFFKILLISVISLCSMQIFAEESKVSELPENVTLFEKVDFVEDNLKEAPVIFGFGGLLYSRSDAVIGKSGSYFNLNGKYPFELSPRNNWQSLNGLSLWGTMNFTEKRFLAFKLTGIMKIGYESVIPLFNIDELYLNWDHPNGKIVIGRNLYTLKSDLNFTGHLDGLEIDINVPYLNFKSFLGFSGLLGVFHPYFNKYSLTAYDRSFDEQTNLTNLVTVVQINGHQSRRIFFATDFDIHFWSHHITPFFLMQYDISNIGLPNFNNDDYTINTFTIGLNLQGKIATNFYYKGDIAGVFGMMQDLENKKTKAIAAAGGTVELRYSIPPSAVNTFSIGYAMGTGTPNNDEDFDEDRVNADQIKKYYYYGKFSGGYVLEPQLVNIHSLSLKYLFTPNDKFSLNLSFFQTFKMYKESPISDNEANLSEYNLGSELDLGFLINFSRSVSVGLDSGLFIPENAYSDKTWRFRVGGTLALSF